MANKIQIDIVANNRAVQGLQEAQRSVQALTSTVAALSSLFTVGLSADVIGRTVKKYADLGEELGKLRSATGLTYRQLQALRQALTEAGTAPEALNTATRILNVNIAQGDKTLAKYGITAKTTYEAILQVGQRLDTLSSASAKAELATAAFGRSSQDLIDTISKFATDENARRGLEAVGFTDEGVARLQKVDTALDNLNRQWTKMSNTFAGIAAGPAAKGIELFTAAMQVAWLTSAPATLGRISGDLRRRTGLAASDAESQAGRFPGGLSWSSGGQSMESWPLGPGPAAGGGGGSGVATAGGIPGLNVNYPGAFFGSSLALRGGLTSSSGWASALARNVSGPVAQPLNTAEAGFQKSLERSRDALATFAAYSQGAWQNMFMRMAAIQTRSNNLIVNLAADLWNSVIAGLAQRLSSSITGGIVDFVTGLIPGFPKGGAKSTTSGGVELHVHTLESKTLTQAILSGSFRDAGVMVARRRAIS